MVMYNIRWKHKTTGFRHTDNLRYSKEYAELVAKDFNKKTGEDYIYSIVPVQKDNKKAVTGNQ